ncbi:MAG: TonB-dependent receptor [Prevotellaceae bacterium]|jgi:iron complex outermembrane receptor protein|nr:TonB-dependent receptor [Prevotellaceae bacterium]
MKKYRLIASAAMLCALQSFAQSVAESDTIISLQAVIVSYRADKSTPVSFLNIDKNELKLKSTGQEPSFLLAETSSVSAYSDAGNTQGYSYYRLRGIDQTRINVTFDGVPMNEPEDQGAYFSNYPDLLNSADRIQIQRGVGTSQNGTASYAGNIQLFSPNLRDSASVTLGADYGSFNSLRAFCEYKSGLMTDKAFYVRLSEIYSDGYKYHSSNHSQSVFASGGLFRDRSSWKINLLWGQQRNELAWLGVTDSLIAIDRRTNAATQDEKDYFTQTLVQLQNKWRVNEDSYLQSSVYYTFLNGNYDFDLNNYSGLPSTDELYNYAFRSHWAGFYANYTLSRKCFQWTSGLHANKYSRKHTGSEKSAGQLYVNTGYKNEASVFSKMNYTFGKITLFADLQYRRAIFDYRSDYRGEGKENMSWNKLRWNFLNPKVGVSCELKNGAVAYCSVGRIGREPTRNDMFGGEDDLKADDSGKPLIVIDTPEYVTDTELGFRLQNGTLKTDVNFFYMNFDNEIVLNGTFGPNGLALTDKVEKSIRTGVELAVEYKLNSRFTLVNRSSYNYSRIREQRESFSPILTPPLIVNQEIRYDCGGFGVSLSVKYHDKSYIDFANSVQIQSCTLVNARLRYGRRNWGCCLHLNNLTNVNYYGHGYVDFDGREKYFVQAPFNFCFSVNYRL